MSIGIILLPTFINTGQMVYIQAYLNTSARATQYLLCGSV